MDNRLLARARQEMEVLAREIGAGRMEDRLSLGSVRVDNREYLGIRVSGLPVPAENFGSVKSVNMLILLPENYPRVPPLGVYLDRPYKAKSSHFVHRGYHGAPSLNERGWYWFCHAFGNFDNRGSAWKPAPSPESGHNLATVVCGARISMAQ